MVNVLDLPDEVLEITFKYLVAAESGVILKGNGSKTEVGLSQVGELGLCKSSIRCIAIQSPQCSAGDRFCSVTINYQTSLN
ncbi:hypothetical protein MJO28_006432 [Puccinia striiformis f. sp. tritici]|nr:hypothetical protein MJO28_006432 [Puccinia striiformis f. sp. tritici]POW19667.1 hypothetical protein PSHT_04420 [Puccinia striiformis]